MLTCLFVDAAENRLEVSLHCTSSSLGDEHCIQGLRLGGWGMGFENWHQVQIREIKRPEPHFGGRKMTQTVGFWSFGTLLGFGVLGSGFGVCLVDG